MVQHSFALLITSPLSLVWRKGFACLPCEPPSEEAEPGDVKRALSERGTRELRSTRFG